MKSDYVIVINKYGDRIGDIFSFSAYDLELMLKYKGYSLIKGDI